MKKAIGVLALGLLLITSSDAFARGRRGGWVRSYTRKDGTHVRGHYRRGSSSVSLPSSSTRRYKSRGYSGSSVYVPSTTYVPPSYSPPSEAPQGSLPYVHVYPFNRQLRESDLRGRSAWHIRLIRNAIFARHGRPFKDPQLAKFFESQFWYNKDTSWSPQDDFSKLSSLEQYNSKFVLRFEKNR